ncbi:MAG: hypothetical protein NXY57DRAFT_1071521 [Lentinula lateritia]|nr:MAG: hypothetical protein NXY57DRAFT_1071521 [Lentinula lateritia]
MTGIEILIITAVSTKLVAVIESNCTSVLIEEARKILNDERIMSLLSLLYELDPKLAVENNKQYTSAASLALEYQNSMAIGQYFGCQDQTSTGERAAQMRANADYSLSSNVKYVQSLPKTPEYILQTPGRAVFAYPQVGSKPILPDGLKFGTLAYYYLSCTGTKPQRAHSNNDPEPPASIGKLPFFFSGTSPSSLENLLTPLPSSKPPPELNTSTTTTA